MTTMTMFSFGPGGGRRAARRLEGFSALQVSVHDAAVVEWPLDESRPETWQVAARQGPNALGGAFWGMFFSHLVLIPLSRVQSPALGPIGSDLSLDHLGFSEAVLAGLRLTVHRGSSSVFVLHPHTATTAVVALLVSTRAYSARPPVSTRLSDDQHRRLYAAFGDTPPDPARGS